jgi:hypothetical protein
MPTFSPQESNTAKILFKLTSIIFIFIIAFSTRSSAQESDNSFWSIQLIEGYEIYARRPEVNRNLSRIGLELQRTKLYNKHIGLQIKTNWHKWTDRRENNVSLLIGPQFSLIHSGGLKVIIYGTAGPLATIGNDYAGVFGTADAGIQCIIGNKPGLMIGLSWSQYPIFHPSHFSFIKGQVGVAF